MLRAARLEQRLGFRIEERTEELIRNALDLLSRTTGERIRHELYLILEEEMPESALCRLDELGVLAQIHPGLKCDDWLRQRFQRLRESLKTGRWELAAGPRRVETSILYLALLTYRLSTLDLERFIERLKLSSGDATLLRQVNKLQAFAG
jgi:tRNA nucleotidyltransferase (CCA-adding enzyme)